MSSLTLLLFLLFTTIPSSAHSFTCSRTGASCNAVVGYAPPNATTVAAVKSLFAVKNLRSLLGANNLPLDTLGNHTVAAGETLRVAFPCVCGNGTGKPKVAPTYKVVKDDGLFHIAAQVFAGLVTYQEIQAFNGIKDANLISIGKKLKIPLPCSCDDVDGESVVHYGHVVAPQSTIEGIAQEYGVSEDTLLKLNGLTSSKDLKAGVTIDVPLKACTSMVGNYSLDYPFVVSNGTYAFTAANCVMCKCDAANNWTLQCQSSNIKSALWKTCPSISCGVSQLDIGNPTTSSGCNSTCVYAGYTNRTIIGTAVQDSTCQESQDNNDASKLGLQWWSTSFFFISIHLFLCHLMQ